jgi:hypothetical protein
MFTTFMADSTWTVSTTIRSSLRCRLSQNILKANTFGKSLKRKRNLMKTIAQVRKKLAKKNTVTKKKTMSSENVFVSLLALSRIKLLKK